MPSVPTRRRWLGAMTPESVRSARAPVLLIFAREPRAGYVKSRLAAALGVEVAAKAYRELIDATMEYAVAARTQGIAAAIEVWCTPDPASPYFRWLAERDGVELRAQCDGDLGIRMSAAIADALTRAPAAILIGTDCPAQGVAALAAAAAALADADVVLGPAEDGGFVLVGTRIPVRFDGVRWSTPHTLRDTQAALARANIRWTELPVSWDVDEPADLARWKAQ
jgi:rSAM/selenodomain-associated transferase 1